MSEHLLGNLVWVVTISNQINFVALCVGLWALCSFIIYKHHLAAGDLILINVAAPGMMCFNAVVVNFELRSSSLIHKHLLRGLFCWFLFS